MFLVTVRLASRWGMHWLSGYSRTWPSFKRSEKKAEAVGQSRAGLCWWGGACSTVPFLSSMRSCRVVAQKHTGKREDKRKEHFCPCVQQRSGPCIKQTETFALDSLLAKDVHYCLSPLLYVILLGLEKEGGRAACKRKGWGEESGVLKGWHRVEGGGHLDVPLPHSSVAIPSSFLI